MDSEHYILGQHNGGVFNHYNHNVYGYCYQNPIALIDPNGKQVESSATATKFSFNEYVDKFQNDNGRCMTPGELKTLKRGCIGVTMINLGQTIGNPKNIGNSYENSTNPCIAFKRALAKAKEIELDKGVKVLVYSTRFWTDDTSKYRGDASDIVDMRGAKFKSRVLNNEVFINFDFGFYDEETNSFWHANHCHHCEDGDGNDMGPMTVYKSDFNKFTRPLLDFNRTIFSYIITNQKVNSSSIRELEQLDPCIESRP
jgi:hypothetical protein